MDGRRRKRTSKKELKWSQGDYGSIAALCNAHGITQTDFYRWRDILKVDGSRLFERGGVDKERQRLESGNRKLRETVGNLTMTHLE